MSAQSEFRPPLACRALVRIASWIVPARLRAEWRARWDTNLWSWWILVERGELTKRDYADVMRYSWGSFVDAFWLRNSRENLRRTLRGGGFVLAAAAAILLLAAASTHGFREARSLLRPLPLTDPDSLMSIRYHGTMDQPHGVPPRLLSRWRSQSALLADLAGYVYLREDKTHAFATANLFSLLGVQPAFGRFFHPEDDGKDVAVLSSRAARGIFGRGGGAIGRTIDWNGREQLIVGVLPDGFWAVSPSVDIWTPLVLEPQPAPEVPVLIGAVARMKPRAAADALRQELFRIATEANVLAPRPPIVTAFGSIPTRPLIPYLMGLGFALFAGGVLVLKGVPLPSGRGWWYWTYFGLKTVSAVAIPFLLWVEINGVVTRTMADGTPRALVVALVVTPAFLFSCAFGVWWSFADQRRRCQVCQQLLTMPVTVGSWGSVLDPPTTEMVCESGHGTLCQPDAVDGAPDRWTNLDPSWGELFSKKR